ncbi:MAG: hypothetical protein FWG21_03035 [Oscillospiraceae bacterium]|nr:hypothetical protein [Oscillospiraceae bacterium]
MIVLLGYALIFVIGVAAVIAVTVSALIKAHNTRKASETASFSPAVATVTLPQPSVSPYTQNISSTPMAQTFPTPYIQNMSNAPTTFSPTVKQQKNSHIHYLKTRPNDEKRFINALCVILMTIFFVDSIYRGLGGIASTLLFWWLQMFILVLYLNKGRNQLGKFILLVIPVLLISLSFALFSDSKGYLISYLTLFILIAFQMMMLSMSGDDTDSSVELFTESITNTAE